MNNDLSLARNLHGKLSYDAVTRIERFLAQPNEVNWNNAYSIILNPDGIPTSFWKAVLAVDPTFPKFGPAEDMKGNILGHWARIHSVELAKQAIAYATH